MSELWYWKSKNRIHGPLVTEELEALVLQHRIADHDQIRLEGSDEWLPARDIRQLFANSTQTDESPATAAARLLETAAARRIQAPAARSASASRTGTGARLASGISTFISGVSELASRALRAVFTSLGRAGRTLFVAAVALGVTAFFLTRFISWEPGDQARLQQIHAVVAQLRRLSDSPDPSLASPAAREPLDWLATTEVQLDRASRAAPVASATSESARRSALARREMLFAVRALRKNPREPERPEVLQPLDRAAQFLSAEIPALPAPQSPASTSGSLIIVSIFVLDTLLIAGFAAWWIAHRKARI